MRAALSIVLATVLSATTAVADTPSAKITGLLTDSRLDEISGAAASRIDPDLLWVVNDSGNPAELLAIDPRGSLRARVRVIGAENRDWEDLASYDHGQGPYIAIADTGDNGGERGFVSLYLVAEPAGDGSVDHVLVHKQLNFSYPDGAHDVESLVIDPHRPRAYVISKRTTPPALYSVDLRALGPQTARLLTPIPRLPVATQAERQIDARYARYRHQPTAMDISCDGRELWILTYSSVQRFVRRSGERWSRALTRQDPQTLALPIPLLPQAEAIAFDAQCRYVTVLSEKIPGPIVRYSLSKPEKTDP